MKLQEARNLIKATFENPFDKGRFTLFVKNLLKDAYEEKTFLQTGGQLPQAFSELIRKMERIGKYQDEEGNIIDILIVELKKGRSIEWARTTQRNFIRRYLNGSRGGELKDAALVAFFSEGSDDWRFSLIKMQYSLEKKADELTPAKRFSFLVGQNERSHTAQNQLANLLTLSAVPTLFEIESSFNIETVTKEFFEKYRDLFLNLNDHIEREIKKSKPLREELESQGIDAVSFTKKLLGQIVFLYFLQKKGWLGVPKNENWNKGDKHFLRSLLNEAIEKKKNFFSDYLVYLFYEALATEHRGGSDPSFYAPLNCRIPFLNGGLFEADYDWKKITISIPNNLFTNSDKTEQGDIGSGVLDVFDRYNFTVKEDEPLEKQVAVDPEMLGKVFENLLEVKDRKSKGAFYTPREIVHYMCQESLIAYLDTSVNGEVTSFQKIGTEQTEMFGNKTRKGQLPLEVEHGSTIKVPRHDLEKFIREGTAAIEHDEAKEAGKLVSMQYALPDSIRIHAQDLDKALADIRICDPAIGSGAFPVGMMNEIVKAREILSVYLKNAKPDERSAYELKRHAIQECIYGVDIEHSAIDIAKLRLWLSLVVDEDDFYKIKPLPNLDYKIVEGNSLYGLTNYSFRNEDAEKELEKLKDDLFDTTDLLKKKQLRKKIDTTIQKMLSTANEFGTYKVDFDLKLYFSEVFHKKRRGFDVIIGNPPYVQLSKTEDFDESYKSYLREKFNTAGGRFNTFIFFTHLGLDLLRQNGVLSFIIPNTILTQDYYSYTREEILKRNFLNIVVQYENLPFENAVVENVTLIIQRTQIPDYEIQILIDDLSQRSVVALKKKSEFIKNRGASIAFNSDEIAEKIFSANYKVLDVYCDVNQAIALKGDKSLSLRDKNPNRKFYKLLDGRNINKYLIEWDKVYLDFNINRIHSCKRKDIFETDEKLFFRRVSSSLIFCYDDEQYFALNTLVVVNKKHSSPLQLKYLLAILNSKLLNYLYKGKFKSTKKVFSEIQARSVGQLPIAETGNQKSFITIVDKILEAKKQDPHANTSLKEKQLDIMVYHLYNLTYEEAKVIDAELTEEDFEKYKLGN